MSLTLVLCLLALPVFALSCAAADGSDTAAQSVREFDKDFDVDLATTLIIIICSVLLALILTALVILAKRNIHN